MILRDDRNNDLTNEFLISELPYFAFTDQIHTEMFSNKKIIIDGGFSVMEYTNEFISLRLKKGRLDIVGRDLIISSFSGQRIVIVGHILSYQFNG